MKTLATTLFCVFSLSIGTSPAEAEDAAAPTLSLATDPDAPRPSITLGVDPLAYVFGSYGVHVEVAVHRFASLSVTPSYIRVEAGRGFSLEGGARFWPFGRGLEWLFVGATAAFRRESAQSTTHAIVLGAEVGWQVVWRGIAIAAAGGIDRNIVIGGDAVTSARVRFLLGYSFM